MIIFFFKSCAIALITKEKRTSFYLEHLNSADISKSRTKVCVKKPTCFLIFLLRALLHICVNMAILFCHVNILVVSFHHVTLNLMTFLQVGPQARCRVSCTPESWRIITNPTSCNLAPVFCSTLLKMFPNCTLGHIEGGGVDGASLIYLDIRIVHFWSKI